jgi:gluconolactonase
MQRLPVSLLIVALVLPAQDFSDIRIERFTGGYTFTEGPVWSRDGYLTFSDPPESKIFKVVPGEKPQVWRTPSNKANGNTFDAKGLLYTCETQSRRVTRTDKKGVVETVAERFEGKRFNAPNDIVVRKDGHVYFTDPAFGEQTNGRELDHYGVYHVTPKLEIEAVAKPVGRPNGIALSPNGRILYVSNSDERAVYAYDLDGQGRATNERKLISGIDGPPDGIKVDEKGNLYVTANHLPIYSPQGKLLHTIEFSETPRNCAFGEPDFQTLFVTARTSVYRVRLPVKGSVQY